MNTRRGMSGMPLRPWPALALVVLLPASACVGDRERLGSPTEPYVLPDLSGRYAAIHLIVERNGSSTELVGEPDTRLDLQLNADGTAQGQLKIGTDPDLRTKVALVGEWDLGVPNTVSFSFSAKTFLSEMAFQVVSTTRLTGEWLGDELRIRVELQKLD